MQLRIVVAVGVLGSAAYLERSRSPAPAPAMHADRRAPSIAPPPEPALPRPATIAMEPLAEAEPDAGDDVGVEYGSIIGTITDATTGDPLPGVTVLVTAAGSGTEVVAVTDGDGEYLVVGLPEGSYRVTCYCDDAKLVQPELAVRGGYGTPADFQFLLHPVFASETTGLGPDELDPVVE